MKGMACRTNLSKQFIVRTANEIIDVINTVYVTKSSEARLKGTDSILIQHLKNLPKLGERIAYVKQ